MDFIRFYYVIQLLVSNEMCARTVTRSQCAFVNQTERTWFVHRPGFRQEICNAISKHAQLFCKITRSSSFYKIFLSLRTCFSIWRKPKFKQRKLLIKPRVGRLLSFRLILMILRINLSVSPSQNSVKMF